MLHRVETPKRVQVAAAKPHHPHPKQHLTFAGLGLLDLPYLRLLRPYDIKCLHIHHPALRQVLSAQFLTNTSCLNAIVGTVIYLPKVLDRRQSFIISTHANNLFSVVQTYHYCDGHPDFYYLAGFPLTFPKY